MQVIIQSNTEVKRQVNVNDPTLIHIYSNHSKLSHVNRSSLKLIHIHKN